MGDPKNVQKKGKGQVRLGSGPGQGWAQQHRRDILLKKGRKPPSAEKQVGDRFFQNQSLVSMGPRKAKLEAE